MTTKQLLARLPKTRDGKPIVPGMRLWWVFAGAVNEAFVVLVDDKMVAFTREWTDQCLFASKRAAQAEAKRRSKA